MGLNATRRVRYVLMIPDLNRIEYWTFSQLLNEEGLPIIDIVEPVPANEGPAAIAAIPTPQEPDVIPLWALSPQEKARRRQ